MKQSLLFVFFLAYILTLHAQDTSNFCLNKKIYEFVLSNVGNSRASFSIAKTTITGTSTFKQSIILLRNIDEIIFYTEFDELMGQLDSSYKTKSNDSLIEKENVQTKKQLFDRFKNFRDKKSSSEEIIQTGTNKVMSHFSEAPEFKAVGEFILKREIVDIHDGSTIKAGKIKEVRITLMNGSIAKRGLKVILDDGSIYYNRVSPINLPAFYRRTKDRLSVDDVRLSYYIEVGDIINYSYFGKFYYPADNDEIILSKTHMRDTLLVGSTINQLIDVSIYTDLLGLLGRKANGLLQTEIAGNIICNTGNILNSDIVINNFIKPYFKLSKFDSKYAQIDSSNIKYGVGNNDTVNRTYINQISYLQAGIKANLLRFGIGTIHQVFLNAGIEIDLTNADSLLKQDITTINYYPEVEYKIVRLKNFGMDCSIKLIFQRLADNAPFVNRSIQSIVSSQATLYYFPFSGSDNKIYLRFNYLDNLNDGKYNFSQFQLGWKTSLFNQKSNLK